MGASTASGGEGSKCGARTGDGVRALTASALATVGTPVRTSVMGTLLCAVAAVAAVDSAISRQDKAARQAIATSEFVTSEFD